MARESSSSRSSSSRSQSAPTIDDKVLLEFYQKKFEEHQREEDDYRKRVDKHLKDLVTDRHELEEELLRRGDKISDLQKALVELQLSIFQERESFLKLSAENEQLKSNEEQLHADIRQLLSLTEQQDLRDRIIYILNDPKVEIGYRGGFPVKQRAVDSETSINKKLKKEIDQLQKKVEELLKVSKTKSDVVLEDCRESLERCREKILQDEIQIKELQKKLQEQTSEKRHQSQQFSAAFLEKPSATSTGFGRDYTDRSQQFRPTTAQRQTSTSASFGRREAGQQFAPDTSEKFTGTSASHEKREIGLQVRPKTAGKMAFTSSLTDMKEKSQQFDLPTSEKFTSTGFLSSGSTKNARTFTRSWSSENVRVSKSDSHASKAVSSHLKDLHLSLILLLKVVGKINSVLNSMQATKIYQRIADIPRVPSTLQEYVEDSSINQLETYLRQGTRLTFDINNMFKSLTKFISRNKKAIRNVSELESELLCFEPVLKELTIVTTETDLLNIDLRRADFFSVLKGTASPANLQDKNLVDFQNIVSNCDSVSKTVSKAVDLVEGTFHAYRSMSELDQVNQDSQFGAPSASLEYQRDSFRRSPHKSASVPLPEKKSSSAKDLEKLLGIYERTHREAENLGLSAETKLLSEKLKATQRRLLEERELKLSSSSGDEMEDDRLPTAFPSPKSEEIIRKIDKTLTKVQQMERGEYFKDDELCRKLVENVNELTKKFQELTEEVKMKSVQEQLSEYSQVTLGKLEELAKKCRNSVIDAEAQIAAQRSKAKQQYQKLRETEELLRESINECLSLKQKVKLSEERREREKYTLLSSLRDRLSSDKDLEDVLNDLVQSISDNKSASDAARTYVCVYCQQGMGHKLCEEKIRELRAEERKSKTMLKLYQQEMKEEKASLKHYREVAEHTSAELVSQNKTMKETIQSLEKKNASLLEQLKVEKNRVKNMERFRRLEIEGFQTDIKNLKTKIKDMEKQLLKAVLVFESDQKDLEFLKTVHGTARRSRDAAAAIRRLKAKLYELENDIKNI